MKRHLRIGFMVLVSSLFLSFPVHAALSTPSDAGTDDSQAAGGDENTDPDFFDSELMEEDIKLINDLEPPAYEGISQEEITAFMGIAETSKNFLFFILVCQALLFGCFLAAILGFYLK